MLRSSVERTKKIAIALHYKRLMEEVGEEGGVVVK
jgi:hypothetical protein